MATSGIGNSPSSSSSSLPLGTSPLSLDSSSSTLPPISVLSHELVATSSPEKSGTGPWGVPVPTVSMTETSGQTYGCGNKTANEHYRRLGKESMKSFLGPMPTDEFLDTFLHRGRIDRGRQPSPARAFAELPKGTTGEKDIYKPLTDALNFRSTINNVRRCPNFSFWDTSEYADRSGPGGALGSVKPDICCYSDSFLHLVGHPKSNVRAKLADMGFVAFWFEIKPTEGQDFFTDPPNDTENRDFWQFVLKDCSGTARTNAVKDLGQAVNYAIEACKRQHRHCCFSISLSRTSARFIRWDRAGAIVSQKFDLIEHPELLCDFLWCFAHISDAERGYDLTVGPATKKEEEIFLRKIAAHICTQVHIGSGDTSELGRLLDEHAQKGSVTSIHLPASAAPYANAKEGKRLLVSRPMVVPLSCAGRGTRTYWAYDESSDKVVFLKDTWRYDESEREGDVIDHLNKQGVENIPEVLYHGDVPHVCEVRSSSDEVRIQYSGIQTTVTQDYVGAKWVCGREVMDWFKIVVVKRHHYRMVLNVAGYTLLRLRGTAELLHASYDAFQASKQAYEKANRLHRDITPGNIIVVNLGVSVLPNRSRRGYLVDWDISKDVESAGPRQEFEVSATWQFLAYHICANNATASLEVPIGMSDEQLAQIGAIRVRRYIIQHDMESILYVVLYCALLWCDHIGKGQDIVNALQGMFDVAQIVDEGKPRGGAGKLENMMNRTHTIHIVWKDKTLQRWLTEVMDLHHPIQNGSPLGISASTLLGEAWKPDALDALWQDILAGQKEEPLSYANRIDNVARWPDSFQHEIPYSALPFPNQPTHASPKRRRAASQDEDAPDPKRIRYSPQVEAPDDASLASGDTGCEVPPSSTYSDIAQSTTSHAHSTWGNQDRDVAIPRVHTNSRSSTRRRGSASTERTVRGSEGRRGSGEGHVSKKKAHDGGPGEDPKVTNTDSYRRKPRAPTQGVDGPGYKRR